MNTIHTPRNKMTGFRMVGSIDIDESTLDDDANYWAMGARGARKRIVKLTVCNHDGTSDECRVNKLLDRFWQDRNSWKIICLKTERARDLIKALVNTELANKEKK